MDAPRSRSRSTSPRRYRDDDRERRQRSDRVAMSSRGGGRDDRRRTNTRFGRGGQQFNQDRMVFISNIPFDVRWMELKDLVREKGGDVAFVELLENPETGRSKGSAVIEFRERESVERCIDNLDRFELGDRALVVKQIRDPVRFFSKVREETGIDFLGRGDRAGDSGRPGGPGGPERVGALDFDTFGLNKDFLHQLGITEGPLTPRVFVANLPFSTNPARVKEIFSVAGSVVDHDVIFDKDGKSRGIAIVEFSHPVEAVQAVSMLHNQRYMDRSLAVKMDFRDPPQPLHGPGELPVGLKTVGMGLASDGGPLKNISDMLASTTPAPINTGPTQGMNNAAANNTGLAGTWGAPPTAQVPPAASTAAGLTQLIANLAAATGLLAQAQKNPNATTSGGPGLQSQPQQQPQQLQQLGNNPNNIRTGGGDWQQEPGDRRTLLIRNLPPEVGSERLRALVKEVGTVRSVDVSGNIGQVVFEQPIDARRALGTFQGFAISGRVLQVELI